MRGLALTVAALLTVPLVADRGEDVPLPLPPAEVLEQLEFPHPAGSLRLPEISPNGNVIVPGRADLAIVYCNDTETAVVTDLSARGAVTDGMPLAMAVGQRCAGTVLANAGRGTRDGCFVVLCYADDYLYREVAPR